jgi:hypothetical protein
MNEVGNVIGALNILDGEGFNPVEDLSRYYEFTLEVKERNFKQTMYLTKEPRKCSKCDNKRIRGWNNTGNYPSVCGCIKKVFYKLKD